MEGDYGARTYGWSAKKMRMIDSINCAGEMKLRDLIEFLDNTIPNFGDEDSADLQYLLKMARIEAGDMLAGLSRAELKGRAKQQYPASPNQADPFASEG